MTDLQNCLKLLRSSSNEEKIAGLIFASRIIKTNDTESIKKVIQAVGTSFLIRILAVNSEFDNLVLKKRTKIFTNFRRALREILNNKIPQRVKNFALKLTSKLLECFGEYWTIEKNELIKQTEKVQGKKEEKNDERGELKEKENGKAKGKGKKKDKKEGQKEIENDNLIEKIKKTINEKENENVKIKENPQLLIELFLRFSLIELEYFFKQTLEQPNLYNKSEKNIKTKASENVKKKNQKEIEKNNKKDPKIEIKEKTQDKAENENDKSKSKHDENKNEKKIILNENENNDHKKENMNEKLDCNKNDQNEKSFENQTSKENENEGKKKEKIISENRKAKDEKINKKEKENNKKINNNNKSQNEKGKENEKVNREEEKSEKEEKGNESVNKKTNETKYDHRLKQFFIEEKNNESIISACFLIFEKSLFFLTKPALKSYKDLIKEQWATLSDKFIEKIQKIIFQSFNLIIDFLIQCKKFSDQIVINPQIISICIRALGQWLSFEHLAHRKDILEILPYIFSLKLIDDFLIFKFLLPCLVHVTSKQENIDIFLGINGLKRVIEFLAINLYNLLAFNDSNIDENLVLLTSSLSIILNIINLQKNNEKSLLIKKQLFVLFGPIHRATKKILHQDLENSESLDFYFYVGLLLLQILIELFPSNGGKDVLELITNFLLKYMFLATDGLYMDLWDELRSIYQLSIAKLSKVLNLENRFIKMIIKSDFLNKFLNILDKQSENLLLRLYDKKLFQEIEFLFLTIIKNSNVDDLSSLKIKKVLFIKYDFKSILNNETFKKLDD
ncbi:neurochondrin [Anaeramoeba flamelloides]|uniref:Neurochondrin n=1 Tax=Anaeramoeba flamelloides TaxID=1746091 RepID=A0ABQ8XSJ7_9EUKA|nr:neurochondrin [Anaeramoeba flamelloides]